MSPEFFIAKRIISKTAEGKFSKPVSGIAISGIALGVAVMIISIAIVTGFKKEITDKVIGFTSHIQLSNFNQSHSYETLPLPKNDTIINEIKKIPGVATVEEFATKAAIIKTEDEILGTVIKGVSPGYDSNFFKKWLKDGEMFILHPEQTSNEIIISRQVAAKLKLSVGDSVIFYFIQDPPRMRRFTISGIYQTGLEEFDNLYVLGDIRHIKRLNDWKETETGGYEIYVNNLNQLENIENEIYFTSDLNYNVRSIKELYPQIFDWLELQNINVIIIILLIVLIAGINMISTLLILILERTSFIALLKSIGAQTKTIRNIFLIVAANLLGKGLIAGNILGLGLCYLQLKTGILTLPEESYYLSFVPININLTDILFLNLATFLLCLFMMIIPSLVVARVRPVRALQFK